MPDTSIGAWGVPLAILSGAIRVSTPYIFVSLGECITEKSGRINLGLEGTLVMGAMVAYAVSYVTGPSLGHYIAPWLGVLAAGGVGIALGWIHAALCSRPRVNDIAVGIAMMLFGIGLAIYLGKPLIKPSAPQLPSIPFGFWASNAAIKSALDVSVLFIIGCLLAPFLKWALQTTRWGLIIRTVGESADSARAMGYSVLTVRTIATMIGGFLAGIGGASLSLYYPGVWNDNLSSGQGLIAVALVIFARWNPINCLYAALLVGGAGALAPSLQSIGVTKGYYLIGAVPYLLILGIMIITCSPKRTFIGAPAELGKNALA